MGTLEKPYLVLVDHSTAAMHVLDDIRALGYRILYLGKDPTLQAASDRHFSINPLADTESFLDAHGSELKELPIAGVYTLLEHAKFSENRIATYLGMPGTPEKALIQGRDKLIMRQSLKKSGLPAIDFRFIPDSEKEPRPPMSFPFIIKPNLGYASGGVQLVKSSEEFDAAIKTVRRLNRFVLKQGYAGEIGTLCEQYIKGPEFSIDSLTVDGETRSFCICGRGFPSEENFQDYIYFSPPEDNAKILPDLQTMIGTALKGMGYTHGPSHTEVRYDIQTQSWYILETALRVGFSGNIGKMFYEISSIPYNQFALRSSLRQLTAQELRDITPSSFRHGVLFTPATGNGGVISSIGGTEFLRSDPRIRFYSLQKKAGDNVIAYPKGLEYLGVILGVADTRTEMEALTHQIANEVVFNYEN